MKYETVHILDLIELVGEADVQSALSAFSCPKNPDVEHFIRKNAINFTRQKLSVTHLVLDENGQIVGFFSLTHKPLVIDPDGFASFSNSDKRRIRKHSKYDEDSDSYTMSAFLLAQFGKNDHAVGEAAISGNDLMALAIDTLRIAQHVIGGGVIFLECEEQEKLLNFYQNPENGYKRYGFRHSAAEQMGYVQLLRFF